MRVELSTLVEFFQVLHLCFYEFFKVVGYLFQQQRGVVASQEVG